MRRAVALTTLTAALVCATGSQAWSGGGNKISPILDCAWNNGDGTFDITLGYENLGSAAVLPVGNNNYVDTSGSGQTTQSYPGQPTSFASGTKDNVWVLRGVPTDTSWVIEGHRATLAQNSPACATKQVAVIGSWPGAALGLLAMGSVLWVLQRRSARARSLITRLRRTVGAPARSRSEAL
ncbi:MAG TPA: hypothetical protein VGN54_00890 [Mycobacteriales bacterium]|nr:hypothetical protein [Mycobacteriales bacterium]